MPNVYNKYHKNVPKEAIYIGRPSPFGNPFSHMKEKVAQGFLVETREQAVEVFEAWVKGQPDLIKKIKIELKGKELVCFCKPLKCHGDVLLQIANED